MSTETLDNIWMHSPPKQHDSSAEQRARLIREMAGSKRSRSSLDSGSIRDDDGLPRGNGWDTISQQMPPTHAPVDFQINTSALKRAFPDFSQHGSSTEDSIEVGRGYKSNVRTTPSRNPPSEDISEALQFSFGQGAKYRLTGTPPIRPRTGLDAKKETVIGRATSKKENMPPKETRNPSGSSGKGSFDSHKTLVDRHATVESDDGVIVKEPQPSDINKQSRATRFASGQAKENYHTPATSKHQLQAMQNNTVTSNVGDAPATNQSYLIPDMPNITELITGRRQDGTPIFNRSVRSKSRFATPNNRRASIKATHAPVENVPVPADTKALYVSLQLLQEKVAELENAKDQSEQKLEDCELEVLQLRSKLEEREHANNDVDSGIEADAEDGKLKTLESQKSKLETSLRTLQERLERANRKITKSESQVTSLTRDRDALHAQLGLAYVHAQDDDESRVLNDEVKHLKKELARVTRDHQKRMAQLTMQEAELRGKIERREKAINEMASLAKELYNARNTIVASAGVDTGRGQPVNDPSLRIDKIRQPLQTHHRSGSAAASQRPRSTSRRASSRQDRRKQMRTDNIDAYDSDVDAARSDAESTTHIHMQRAVHRDAGLAKDADFMSFMDGDEVEKLRFVVDDEKAKLADLGLQMQTEDTGRNVQKKPTMKRVSYAALTDRSFPASERGNTTRDVTVQRQDTQQSAMSQTSERRRRSAALRGEDTSAFLVPDVTLRQAKAGDTVEKGNETAKFTTRITRPIPVSDRMPKEDDATVRPVQDPALALATVIQNLESEIGNLRSELIQQEALYNQHDPSLSKRKRKIVFARISKLLAAIEIRADQIYALYDVLEGQKASGQMMKEDEVEVTLQNLGLGPEAAIGKQQSRKLVVEDDSEGGLPSDAEDSEDDFPTWNGLEPTQTQTLDHLPRISVR